MENQPSNELEPKVTGVGGIFFSLKILRKPKNGTARI